MSRYYNKDELKQQLEVEQIYDLLEMWGGEPEYTDKGIVAHTICHNAIGHGSRKLYYYSSTRLCICYTHCGTFDIFDLCIKVKKIQDGIDWKLYDAMAFIADYFGFSGVEAEEPEDNNREADWKMFKRHDFIREIERPHIQLPEYDVSILTRLPRPRILSWEKEGITKEICSANLISYYPGGEQIVIPHFDINNRLVGIRGRALSDEEAERFGKYRPLKIGKTLYSHPLSMNLYNLNKSKENIKKAKAAIVFESEKSCMKLQALYGHDNDISVAVCGSAVSSYHISLLQELGVTEIIIAFDRQFVEIGDDEFKRLKNKLIHINKRYGTKVRISAIFDKNMILPYKDAPIDQGAQIFEKLLNERIIPE